MKLVKIGSSPSCDVVLNSEFVSSHHADLTLLDNGEIIIEDKGSTNGTFIGDKRLEPGQEVTIRKGDAVKLADSPLIWAKVPQLDANLNYKKVYNIGSSRRNDIIVSSKAVSRYHACLKIDHKDKVYIVDNGSTNGTKVNGMKIREGIPVKLGKKDNVICADSDITDLIKPYIAPSMSGGRIAMCALGAAVIIALIAFLVPWGKIIKTKVDPADYRNSVAYVVASFHYELSLEDNPLPSEIVWKSEPQVYQATAFFVDAEGRLATNRHVALPWEYREQEVTDKLTEDFEEYFASQIKINRIDSQFEDYDLMKAIYQLQSTELGRELLGACSSEDELNARINRLRKSRVKITGVIDRICVGYPGRYYTEASEFQLCNVLGDSGNPDVDVALLQLNTKKTPAEVKKYLSIDDISEKSLRPQKDRLHVIGYPMGIQWGMDAKTKSLEPNIRSTYCSKLPGKYDFEFDASSVGGSSGSPVFNEYGELVGILNSGYKGQSVTFAVLAKYLKQLYESEVGKK